MTCQFTIRRGRPGEESAIHEAHMRSIREVCVKDHGKDEIRGWGYRPLGNRWADALKGSRVWVVESEGEIFGLGYTHISASDSEARAHLHALYLRPEALGKGLGKEIALRMLEEAKAAGAKSVTLESTLTAHRFYEQLGFRDTGPMATQDIAGFPVRYYPMELKFD